MGTLVRKLEFSYALFHSTANADAAICNCFRQKLLRLQQMLLGLQRLLLSLLRFDTARLHGSFQQLPFLDAVVLLDSSVDQQRDAAENSNSNQNPSSTDVKGGLRNHQL